MLEGNTFILGGSYFFLFWFLFGTKEEPKNQYFFQYHQVIQIVYQMYTSCQLADLGIILFFLRSQDTFICGELK
jgi:hypothetical protein